MAELKTADKWHSVVEGRLAPDSGSCAGNLALLSLSQIPYL